MDNFGLTRGGGVVLCMDMGVIRRITKRNNGYQVNLPKQIKDVLNLDVGDYLFVEIYGEKSILMHKIDLINYPKMRRLLPAGDPSKYDEPRD